MRPSWTIPFCPPDGQHLCGTDKLGRDVLSRVIYGTRSSLSMTLILVGVIFVVGTGLGILAGYLAVLWTL